MNRGGVYGKNVFLNHGYETRRRVLVVEYGGGVDSCTHNIVYDNIMCDCACACCQGWS